ncbi:MAG: CsbD family protein [Acidimicrobiales bacterium]
MGNKAEDMKGRAKEAAGDLTDDDELKAEGKTDQASASIKDKASDAVDKVKDAVTRD